MPKPTRPSRLPRSLRKGTLPRDPVDVWEAGLGALAESLDGRRARFDAFVAEGRRVEAQGGKAVRRALRLAESAARLVADTAFESAEDAAGRLAEAALGASSMPTRTEVEVLRALVARLEARVAAMAVGGTVSVTVEASGSGWTVAVDGDEASTHRTKKAALTAARAAARGHAPARLIIYRTDGTVGEEMEYA